LQSVSAINGIFIGSPNELDAFESDIAVRLMGLILGYFWRLNDSGRGCRNYKIGTKLRRLELSQLQWSFALDSPLGYPPKTYYGPLFLAFGLIRTCGEFCLGGFTAASPGIGPFAGPGIGGSPGGWIGKGVADACGIRGCPGGATIGTGIPWGFIGVCSFWNEDDDIFIGGSGDTPPKLPGIDNSFICGCIGFSESLVIIFDWWNSPLV
jgi:hypothetical protein